MRAVVSNYRREGYTAHIAAKHAAVKHGCQSILSALRPLARTRARLDSERILGWSLGILDIRVKPVHDPFEAVDAVLGFATPREFVTVSGIANHLDFLL